MRERLACVRLQPSPASETGRCHGDGNGHGGEMGVVAFMRHQTVRQCALPSICHFVTSRPQAHRSLDQPNEGKQMGRARQARIHEIQQNHSQTCQRRFSSRSCSDLRSERLSPGKRPCQENIFLGRKMPKHRSARHTAIFGDFINRRPFKASAQKTLDCGLRDLTTKLLCLALRKAGTVSFGNLSMQSIYMSLSDISTLGDLFSDSCCCLPFLPSP